MNSQVAKEYNEQSKSYDDYATSIPYGDLEAQLFRLALGDCSGLTVLDLGGGSGLKARDALDAGAASVDVVDISAAMMQSGQDMEASLGREGGRLRWHEADVSKPLDHLPLQPSYDLVLACWVFDHAHDMAEYDGMWRNCAAYLRPGGRFLGVRMNDPRGPALDGRYGVCFKDFQETPDGVHYRYVLELDPPLEYEASSLNVSMAGSHEVPEKYGITGFETVPPEDAPLVKGDPMFWKQFLEHPVMVVFKGKKMLEV
ncbi:S-adenosyl-L-methionine-dependent methyltransferase [Apiospora rasikravindrae]|uniref:S-adenosyl-L-methionine-dependent methyltransferase n=1 Tax=Apiospora rasikravindrae TaxID=990691 RepID=A0ABR1U0W9_9PEZI